MSAAVDGAGSKRASASGDMPNPKVEFHFIDMDDPARYKRLKVSRACDFCRKRKTKCDVAGPAGGTCSNCARNGRRCTFTEATNANSGSPPADRVKSYGQSSFATSLSLPHRSKPINSEFSQTVDSFTSSSAVSAHYQQRPSIDSKSHLQHRDNSTESVPFAQQTAQAHGQDKLSYPSFHSPSQPQPKSVSANQQQQLDNYISSQVSHSTTSTPSSQPNGYSTVESVSTDNSDNQSDTYISPDYSPVLPSMELQLDPLEAEEVIPRLSAFLGKLVITVDGRAAYASHTAISPKLASSIPNSQQPPPLPSSKADLSLTPFHELHPQDMIYLSPFQLAYHPIPELEQHLLGVYFRNVHPYMPILYKAHHLRQAQVAADKVPVLLRYAMMAAASPFSDHPRIASFAGPDGAPGGVFYEKAKAMLDTYLDVPRLSSLQALLLLVKYQEYIRKRGFTLRTRLLLNNCVQMMSELELVRMAKASTSVDPMTIELSRRTYWQIYIFDRLCSISQGRLCLVDELETGPPFPSPFLGEDNFLDRQTLQLFIESIKIIQLNTRVIRWIREAKEAGAITYGLGGTSAVHNVTMSSNAPYQSNGLSGSSLSLVPISCSTLDEQLLEWQRNLPPDLQPDYNYRFDINGSANGGQDAASSYTPIMNPATVQLHMIFEITRIMLHRACFGRPVPMIPHVDICRQSALNITFLADVMESVGDGNGLPQSGSLRAFQKPARGVYSTLYGLALACHVYLVTVCMSRDAGIMSTSLRTMYESLRIMGRLTGVCGLGELTETIRRLEDSIIKGSLQEAVNQSKVAFRSNPNPRSRKVSNRGVNNVGVGFQGDMESTLNDSTPDSISDGYNSSSLLAPSHGLDESAFTTHGEMYDVNSNPWAAYDNPMHLDLHDSLHGHTLAMNVGTETWNWMLGFNKAVESSERPLGLQRTPPGIGGVVGVDQS